MPKIRQNINPYQGSIEAIIRPNWDGDDGEMHNIFHVDAEDTTCVLHLKFDEGSGSTAYDSSIYGNNGTIHGATWSSGVVGSGLSFDGTDDYCEIQDDNSLHLEKTLSLCFWVNPATSKYVNVLRKYSGISSPGIKVEYNLSTTPNSISIVWGGSVYKNLYTGTNSVVSGNNYFITYVVSTDYGYLYLNSELRDSDDFSGIDDMTNTLPLYIGQSFGISDYFNGVIDEPSLFSRALSASEIKAIYENGRTGIGLAKGKDNYLGFLVPGVGVSYDVSSWTAGNTYHVIGSWDKENAYLYINGSLVASGARDTSAVIASVDDSIYVGNILGTVTADGYVHTRVYDVVLPATKSTAATQGLPQWMSVEGLYNSGSPIDAPVTEHVLFKYPST